MPVLPDAVHLPKWAFLGSSSDEWIADEMEMNDLDYALMMHLPTQVVFVVEPDPAPLDGVLQRYALLIQNGELHPLDREGTVVLGRAAIWYHLQQDPQIKAAVDKLDTEARNDGRVS